MLFLGLLVCFTLVWFGWFGGLFCLCLLCCALLSCFALLCLLGLLCLIYLLFYARICDAWLCRINLARLCLSPLGLVWLDRLASWHAFYFEQTNPWNLSKREHTTARFDVEHDFKKTQVPSVILKFVFQHTNFTRLLNPYDFWHAQKGTRLKYIYTLSLYIFEF